MEIEFDLNKKQCEFIYNLNNNKLKLVGLEEEVVLYLKDKIKADESIKKDFISYFNNELNMIKTNKIISFEKDVVIPNVGTRFFVVRGKLIERKNIVKGIIVDETSNRLLQQKKVHAEKLRSLGALAGGIAHDFNNQLMVILGSCQLLNKHIKDEKLIPYLQNIETSAKNSSELITKLLTFGHVDRVPKTEFNLLKAINDTISILEHTSTKKVNILFDCFIDEIMINGNFGLIQNALLNVCKNSIESFDKDGMLVIKASTVHLKQIPEDIANNTEFKAGVYGQIKIADNGCGIDKDTINKIFDPFFTTKGFEKGTGLGLSTVLGTVESHEGLIGVKSVVGKGTTFTLYFRLTKEAETMCLSDKELKQIMIIDDEYLVRMVLKDILLDLGYAVTSFENGVTAVEYYKVNKDNIDLVICDMVMPEMTGKEVFNNLKEINPNVKFIVLSGYNNEDEDNFFSSITSYLTKPIMLNTLGEVVEKALK